VYSGRVAIFARDFIQSGEYSRRIFRPDNIQSRENKPENIQAIEYSNQKIFKPMKIGHF
jgi:hypothetical protein